MRADMDTQIHYLEKEAYFSVLRAFKAQSDAITWDKEALITELRKELRVSDDEHREVLGRVNDDDSIRRIREWRQTGGHQVSMLHPVHDILPSPTVSGSRKRQRTSHSQPLPSLVVPSSGTHHHSVATPVQPSPSVLSQGRKSKLISSAVPNGKSQYSYHASSGVVMGQEAAGLGKELIGRKVLTRWPDDNKFYEAVITQFNRLDGRHALVYDMNTTDETWEWVDLKQMLLAQKFQEMFLKIILERSEFVANFVPLGTNIVCESRSSTFYLLLPVIPKDHLGMMTIDWKVIKKCLSSPVFSASPEVADCQNTPNGTLKLVDGPASVNDVLNSLVYAAHKKSFFFVSELLIKRNAYNTHNASSSHIDHMLRTHGIQLSYHEQPLLRAKQLFCLHNLLHNRRQGNSEIRKLEEHFFELQPELCQLKIVGFSKEIGSSISLLPPSLMHHLENLLVAIELKNRMSTSFPEGSLVTAKRVLEALTTEKCSERFSSERLEVLGDAFLKFAVGRHLFLTHDTIDEGQLTGRRSRIVNNSNLYKIAIRSKLQVYIRDEEFDPGQFFAFGHPCSNICTKELEESIHPVPNSCPSKSRNAWPLKCSKKHQWLYKKTVADVVESLVGAYLVDSGFKAATAFLRWIGIKVDFEVSKVQNAGVASGSFMLLSSRINIPFVEENILKHKFHHKGLLVQAFLHPSYNCHNGGCYQRLEFLGDAVLDYLITSYLYSGYPDLKPGQLTDLRSALVNNAAFAKIAINHGLYKNIICDSRNLGGAIDKYVKYYGMQSSSCSQLEEPKCPKALGDLVESCFGAILLDVGFDLNLVWRKMLYFLNPTMTFSNLQLNPLRELTELCQFYKWDLDFISLRKNKRTIVEAKVKAEVEGKSCCWSATDTYSNGKAAKGMAAKKLLTDLKAQGYRVKSKSLEEILKESPRGDPLLIGYDENPVYIVSPNALGFEGLSLEEPSTSESTASPDALRFENLSLEEPSTGKSTVSPDALRFENLSLKDPSTNERAPPLVQSHPSDTHFSKFKGIKKTTSPSDNGHKLQPNHLKHTRKLDKSGSSLKQTAKSRLHEICTANCWMPPVFECCNEQGPSHLKLFTYRVVVEIDEADVEVECYGKPHSKKKDASEHAAEGALWLLKKEGYLSDSDSKSA